jgi:outer membrane receptor protein involved in Fe transport
MNHKLRSLKHAPRTSALAASIGALIAAGGVNGPAFGQDEDAETSARETESIVVTGTRIRRDDFSSAQATTVVTAADMERLGIVSVADMVNQLPNNIATVSPESTASSPFMLGASIANMRGLNTAYGVRTLTMIDSRRATPTNNGGGVDMNFIPSALVGRVETVTGGASATYGSDAMAGVVNVILDDSIENIRLDLNYQTTDEGDGDQYTLSFGTGFDFFDRRGSLVIGWDSSRQDAIEDCTTREFCRRSQGLFRNGQSASTYGNRGADIVYPGLPEYYTTTGQRYTVTTSGVLPPSDVASPAFFGDPGDAAPAQVDPNDLTLGWYQFNDAGTDMEPYLDHLLLGDLRAVNSLGTGTGFFGNNYWGSSFGEGKLLYSDIPIVPETNRDNLFLRFKYELEGGIEIGADLTMGQTESTTLQYASRGNLQALCVQPYNA